MRFLVVDSSATMRRLVVNSLKRIGYDDVVKAEDGMEALRLFDESVGCVITEWDLPKINGIDLVRALRTRPDGASVAILMITTRTIRADILAAIDAGVNNYVVRPFTPRVLKEKLDVALRMAATG